MKRSKREVAAAIERIEAVGCTNIGDEERPLLLRPNDLRRVVDHFDDLSAEVKRLRRNAKKAHAFVAKMPGHALRQDVLALLALKPVKR